MKIIILGASGMIGSTLFSYLRESHEVMGTLRLNKESYDKFEKLNLDNIIYDLDVRDTDRIHDLIVTQKPDVLINATGIVKQVVDQSSKSKLIEINALIPHKLHELCLKHQVRHIQFSTDCVFSGLKGNYGESDIPDPQDLYGLSKYTGEIHDQGTLTLRTSTIGLEVGTSHGLIEWFLSERGEIQGYSKAIYTGITTIELAKFVEEIISRFDDISGLWQVSGERISKYELLSMLKEKLNRTDIEILRNEEYICDRSLSNSKILNATNYQFPSWDKMLDDLSIEIRKRRKLKNDIKK
mgnify:CR=1 FL=1